MASAAEKKPAGKLCKIFWGVLVVAWTSACIYGVARIVPTYTDPGSHVGKEITLTYQGLDAILVTSDQPIFLQIGKYGHRFTFLNTDDGSVAQGLVVSTNIQNVSGHMAYQFGPTVVSQGHWKRAGGNDYDTSPDLTFTSGSGISITTYPGGSSWWVWTKGIVIGLLIWVIAGALLAMVGEWSVLQFIKILKRYPRTVAS